MLSCSTHLYHFFPGINPVPAMNSLLVSSDVRNILPTFLMYQHAKY